MGFMNSMKSTLNEDFNESYTENGALGYRTTGKHLLDLNFKVASLRKADAETIISGFDKAFSEDHIHALKWLFYLRDAREGLGERRSFRIIMSHLANVEPEISKVLIGLIAEYGRSDDLLSLLGTECEKDTLELIKNQLMKDLEAKKANKPVSLFAKWLPSCNATSHKTRENAAVVRKYLGFTERQYRKILSELREYIDVVERKMSAKKWGEINYEAVPSKANLIYNNAFLKNDEERRREYLDKLEKGEAKINSSTNFPHDIVHSYLKGRSYYRSNIKEDKALEALWKALPDTVQGDGNTLVVRDGSGSMMCSVDPNTSITALEVATALAIYFSERCFGEFKDNFITFSSRPELIDLSACSSLAEKIRRCYAENDCSNTDIEKTFDLILQTAINTNMKQEDIYIKVPRRDRLIKILQRKDDIEEAKRRDASDVGQFDGIEDEVTYVIENPEYKFTPQDMAEFVHQKYTSTRKTSINKCKTILCDVDEVINNLVEKILVEYNKQYNDSLTLNDITDWEVKKFIKPECENIFTEFGTDEFLSSLELQPKAKEVIGKLMAKYNFYFVTSTYPDHVRVKDEWLKRNIPQYDSGMLVVCRDKHLVHGDILIDDCIGNFTLDHTKDSPVKYNFIFDKPWNRSVQEDNTKNFRVHGWDEIYELIDKLEDF